MSNSRAAYDEDRLPWLEEVEDEDGPRGVSATRMLAIVGIVIAAAAILAATFFWLGRSDGGSGSGAPELIRAPAEPYKVKPENPGGLDVAGESQTAFETSAGQDVDAQLDTSRLPQQPPEQPPAEPEPKRIPPNETREPAPPEPGPDEAPRGARGSVIQLGAFKNTAQAERAWTALTARFPELSGLSKMVVPYSAGGSSGYRLRAGASSPAEAQAMCRAIEAGGERCFIAR